MIFSVRYTVEENKSGCFYWNTLCNVYSEAWSGFTIPCFSPPPKWWGAFEYEIALLFFCLTRNDITFFFACCRNTDTEKPCTGFISWSRSSSCRYVLVGNSMNTCGHYSTQNRLRRPREKITSTLFDLTRLRNIKQRSTVCASILTHSRNGIGRLPECWSSL